MTTRGRIHELPHCALQKMSSNLSNLDTLDLSDCEVLVVLASDSAHMPTTALASVR